MERFGLTPDKNEIGIWRDQDGEAYILNSFKGDESNKVHLGPRVWSCLYDGARYRIDWSTYTMPSNLLDPIRDTLKSRLFTKAPKVISSASNILNSIEKAYQRGFITKNLYFNVEEMSTVWNLLSSTSKSDFRSFFKELSQNEDPRVDPNISFMMKSWKARNNVLGLRSVLEWNPKTGALTTAELELLRQSFPQTIDGLSNRDALGVILLRTYLATLRRTQQITQVRLDGLEIVQPRPTDPKQYFLVVSPVKAQAGSPPEWESVPQPLGEMIVAYSKRPDVAALQRQSNFLFILPHTHTNGPQPGSHYELSSVASRQIILDWVAKQNIISPRTGKPLHVTMQRLRHTGATQLARQGYSRQVIQDMLQHDSPHSASSYIDSVASDLTPLFERVDRHTGNTFEQIQGAFFKGKIVSKPEKPAAPILTPKPDGMAIVGSCKKNGVCGLHPLFSCYSGCPHFLAFKEAPHSDTLAHVEKEYAHWREAEPNGSRSKVIKDFERTIQGVKDVISQIEHEETSK